MINIRRYQSSKEDAGINISPLIDMVFILLIFFVVTTSFIKETGVEVNKPIASTAHRIDKGNVLIAVTKMGTIHIENRQIDLLSVRPIVKKALSDLPNSAVVIVSDNDAKTGLVIRVLDQCKLAGAKNVSIAARRE